MKVKLRIDLNGEEKELLLKQVRREYSHHIKMLSATKRNKGLTNTRRAALVNIQVLRCLRLCKIAKQYELDMTQYYVDQAEVYDMDLFTKDYADTFHSMWVLDGSYVEKLFIHIMYRAGIISKETRNQLLSIKKERGQVAKEKAKRRRIEKFQKAFEAFVQEITQSMNGDEKRKFIYSLNPNKTLAETFGEQYVINPMAFLI